MVTRLNIPTFLTIIRLVSSLLILPFLLVYLLPLPYVAPKIILALFFAFVSLTDFFDGYLARRFGQETLLGRLLDPIADKFLLYATLTALVYLQRVYFYWAVLFIGREFLVTSLREIALSFNFSLRVIRTAKLKTILQMTYCTWVILFFDRSSTQLAIYCGEYILLVAALSLSLWSLGEYMVTVLRCVKGANEIS
jgi:CDP-diacylglycerol--glycerol-3-phosphate 3-phosphatidyltransferase